MNPARTFNPTPLRTVPISTAAAEAARAFCPEAPSHSIFWTATARSALRAVLLHLREIGALADECDQILVPQWACNSLYATIQKVCFPTNQPHARLKGVLVYHQFGFPQKLDEVQERCHDRGLFIIENCVNCAFDGRSHGIGSVGIASVFSLPKMFRTTSGGALVTDDPNLERFCGRYFADDERWIERLIRGLRGSGVRSQRIHELVYGITDYARGISDADERQLRHDIATQALQRRRRNYLELRTRFDDTPIFEGLELDVLPFVAPAFGPIGFLKGLAAALSRNGFESGVYQFDRARNVFEPRFEPCVPLPVHQGLTDNEIGLVIDVVRSEWRRQHV